MVLPTTAGTTTAETAASAATEATSTKTSATSETSSSAGEWGKKEIASAIAMSIAIDMLVATAGKHAENNNGK